MMNAPRCHYAEIAQIAEMDGHGGRTRFLRILRFLRSAFLFECGQPGGGRRRTAARHPVLGRGINTSRTLWVPPAPGRDFRAVT